MPDPSAIVKKANAKLLSSLPALSSTAFDYFHQVFVGLSDDITAEDYKKTLEDYLSNFIGLAEGSDKPMMNGNEVYLGGFYSSTQLSLGKFAVVEKVVGKLSENCH